MRGDILTWATSFGLLSALACSPSGRADTPNAKNRLPEKPPSAARQAKAGKARAEALAEGGWWMFRGGPRHLGRAARCGPRSAHLRWAFKTQGPIYADAAVAPDKTVYVASHDGRLYAVSASGEQLWAYDTEDKIWSSPAIGRDGTLYVGSDSDALFALDSLGKLRWRFSPQGPPEKGKKTPAGRFDVDTSVALAPDGTIYFGCHSFLYALWPSGELKWRFTAGGERAKVWSSPAIGRDGTIYFGTQGRVLFALAPNAAVRWNVATSGDNDAAPSIGDDGTIYFGSDDGKLRAVVPGGALRFAVDLGGPIRAPLAIAADGSVLASAFGSDPFIAAFDGATSQEKWRFHLSPGEGNNYGIQSGALVDAEGFVYFGGRDQYVYCLSPEGRLVWRFKTDGQVDASPVLGPDGTLFIGSDDGKLYAFGENLAS